MSIKIMSVYIDDCTTRKEVVLKIRELLDHISFMHKNVEFRKVRMSEDVAYRLGFPNTLSIYNVPICIDHYISSHVITVEYSAYFTTFLVDDPLLTNDKKKDDQVKALPEIKNVIFNNPATIIFWADETKTIVKCQDGDVYDPGKGLAIAIAKKALGNKGNFNNVFEKWLSKEKLERLSLYAAQVQNIVDKFNQSMAKAWDGRPVNKLFEEDTNDKN